MSATSAAPQARALARDSASLPAATHLVLLGAAAIALAPTLLIILNSFKDRVDVFTAPYQPPIWFTAEPELGLVNIATLEGYAQVFDRAPVASYMLNSLIVTVGSLALIVVLGSDGLPRPRRVPLPGQPTDLPLPHRRHHDPHPPGHGEPDQDPAVASGSMTASPD